MYYRIKLINTKTGESRLTTQTFRSMKKAHEFAEQWEAAVPNAECKIIKI